MTTDMMTSVTDDDIAQRQHRQSSGQKIHRTRYDKITTHIEYITT